MSGDASAPTREAGEEETEENSRTDEYEEMLETLDSAIDQALQKVETGRVYDVDNEKVRIKWIRALAYAVNVRRQVTTDRDLEELNEKVERLKELNGLES